MNLLLSPILNVILPFLHFPLYSSLLCAPLPPQAAGVRGGGLPVQAPPRGAGADQPADPGKLRLREPLHPVHHGDPQGGLGAARHQRQQVREGGAVSELL